MLFKYILHLLNITLIYLVSCAKRLPVAHHQYIVIYFFIISYILTIVNKKYFYIYIKHIEIHS